MRRRDEMDISWIFTTPGVGGIVVSIVLLSAATIYFAATRWILRGGEEERAPWERMGWPFE
jgi:hypothetical protein